MHMRAGTGSGAPGLDLRQRDGVLVCRFGFFTCPTPWVFAEARDGLHRRFIKRLGFDVHAGRMPLIRMKAQASRPRGHRLFVTAFPPHCA